jgi:hypothetical protein
MQLALSLIAQYEVDKAILSRPISTLAKMKGLHAEEVYDRLIPELAGKDFGEVIRFAEVGLKYASIVDRNRLREEIGLKFITATDMIINIVREGLDSKDKWVKRKAMSMHGNLIDEQAEKQRFIETLMTEKKMQMLAESRENLSSLEKEIVDLEEKEDGVFGDIIRTAEQMFYPPVEYGKYC